MARQNYGFEKRQRELAQQKKKEAKRQRKLELNAVPPEENLEKPADEAKPVQAPT